MGFRVTPWDVEGEIDYDRLVKEFGVQPLDEGLKKRLESITGPLHFMIRRGVVFAHRDLKWLLDEYDKGSQPFLYTGCGPSGPLHVGHLAIWMFTRWLQEKLGLELWFQITDDEKFLFKDKSFDEIQKWTHENMLDVIALGFDPCKTHFLVDTWHAGHLYPEAIKVAKKITFSTIKASFGLDDSRNIGEIFYTSMQAAPVMLPSTLCKRIRPCLIPLAIDQDPHFRIARDVYPKIGHYKPAIIHSMFIPPLQGEGGKMSSSRQEGAVLTTDGPKEVKRKIMKYAFSGGQSNIEEHRRLGGNPDIDVSFQYLRMLFEDDDEKLERIRDDYSRGVILTGELKKILIDKMNQFLEGHQRKREAAREKIDEFLFDPSSYRIG